MPIRHSARKPRKDKLMNNKIKLLIVAFTLALFCLIFVSCSNKSVYDDFNKDGYTVTIKYDANGGYFKDSLNVGFSDTYDISNLTKNENGKVEIMLFDPNSDQRGEKENKYPVTRGDGQYYLAGWFTEKTEIDNGDGTVSYLYSGKWDFSKPLEIDPNAEYSAAQPYKTLYAVWNEKTDDNYHKIEIYDVNDPDKLVAVYQYGSGNEPTVDKSKEIKLPQWDKSTGELSYGALASAKIDGKTLEAIYLDASKQTKIEGTTYMHPVSINDKGELENRVLKLYVEYKEGNWYKVYNAKQVSKINDPSGCYELMADLDFSKADWPSNFTASTFTGKIIGNGNKIKNAKVSNSAEEQFALFKAISKDAVIKDVTFESTSVTIKNPSVKAGAKYAFFAISIEDGFVFDNVLLENSTLLISAKTQIQETILNGDYKVALLCAEGYHEGLNIDISGILFKPDAKDSDSFELSANLDADGNKLHLIFTAKKQNTDEQ